MRADVLLQHAGLLAADAALLTDVLPPTAPAHVHIVLVGLVPGMGTEREGGREGEDDLVSDLVSGERVRERERMSRERVNYRGTERERVCAGVNEGERVEKE